MTQQHNIQEINVVEYYNKNLFILFIFGSPEIIWNGK